MAGEPMIEMHGKLSSENGYALPSVLFIIVLLSITASSIMMLQYFDRRIASLEVEKVKSQFAAESALSWLIGETKRQDILVSYLGGQPMVYHAEDESGGSVTLQPWGVFLLARSEGYCNRTRVKLVALLASEPPEEFRNALLLGNGTHQLIMTGKASIKGDVTLGRAGATIGNLFGTSTPLKLPIEGKIRALEQPGLPPYHSACFEKETAFDSTLLSRRAEISAGGETPFPSLENISDTIENIAFDHNLTIISKVARREIPLTIVVNGSVDITGTASIAGLVRIVAGGPVIVRNGATITHGILFSDDSFSVESGANISAQIIAPSIIIDSGAVLHYPSVLASCAHDSMSGQTQKIILRRHARVEGIICFLTRNAETMQSMPRVTMEENAEIIGALYSEGKVTMDGAVFGSVLAKDFCFYISPTFYVGWLRKGAIDRSKLPQGYAIPMGFSGRLELKVLDWL